MEEWVVGVLVGPLVGAVELLVPMLFIAVVEEVRVVDDEGCGIRGSGNEGGVSSRSSCV
jgi:hypothetical protein